MYFIKGVENKFSTSGALQLCYTSNNQTKSHTFNSLRLCSFLRHTLAVIFRIFSYIRKVPGKT